MSHWDGENRRKTNGCPLSTEQFERIAEAAAEKAIEQAFERFYIEIGKSAVRAVLLALGAVAAAVLAWIGVTKGIPKA